MKRSGRDWGGAMRKGLRGEGRLDSPGLMALRGESCGGLRRGLGRIPRRGCVEAVGAFSPGSP